ncbi:MAG: polysaccharide biosynthesis tyrosine autokinase [Kiritimatiellae bacterium]|nr:polysaccharide biosynthesis tyrosine autokinase [Kiritimatiellia bacterium]MDW8458468.1 polysaccharide biosynthesis tyrosine autokinase [Verrucomicrobiota bacterium]
MRKIIEPPAVPRTIGPNLPAQDSSARAQADVTPQPAPTKSFDLVDLKHYFHIVVKRIWLVALCFFISLSVTIVNMVNQVPVYRASASVVLSRGLNLPERLKDRDLENVFGDIIDTQMRILQSGTLIARARERLNRPPEEISAKLQRISVYPLGRASILVVSVDALDPQFAADFANAMIDAYMDYKAEERMETSQATVISLTQQANRLREELKRAEERVLAFKRENSVIAIEERGNVAAKMLANLSSRAAECRAERMILQAQQPLLNEASDEVILQMLGSPAPSLAQLPIASVVDRGTNFAMSSGAEGLLERGVLNRPRWSELRQEKLNLEGRLAMMREKFNDNHPQIQITLARIREVQAEIDREVQFALQQFYSQLESLQLQEKAINRAEREWEAEALDVSRKADEYAALLRDVARLRGLYDLIFNRLKEIDITIGIEPETIRPLERARPSSTPITPRRLQSLFLAAVIGLGIGIGLVFALEFLDDSIRYPEDVQKALRVEFLGIIPAASWDPEDLKSRLLSNIDPKSGLVEAYRNVRSALLTLCRERDVRSLAITSAVPKEGKTTTAINLAISLAQAGMRVLLIDADLRRGELHKFFGLEGGRGFSDVLSGQAKPESVIQRTTVANLDLVATGPFPPNPAELVLRPEFGAFMDYARRAYDRILFDCPPVMAVSESAMMASQVEGTVFVIWAGQTSRRLVQLSLQLVRQRGGSVLGCVLNNLEFGRVGYYYYSTYYGYYGYDYGYEPSPSAVSTSRRTG